MVMIIDFVSVSYVSLICRIVYDHKHLDVKFKISLRIQRLTFH